MAAGKPWLLWLTLMAAALLPAQAQEVFYIHTDALGSVVAETDANGNVVQRSEYEPYGRVLNRPVKNGPGYTGHVEDAATGLTYMQQRYYDPTLGRFLSVDPIAANPNTGASFNRYAYVLNNPYKFTDPDGRCERVTGSHICGGGRAAGAMLATSARSPMDMGTVIPQQSSISGAEAQLVNPTGGGIRNDAGGKGHFGAPRGTRKHGGVDLDSTDGQTVVSPVSGSAVNIKGATKGVPMVDITPSDRSTIQFVRLLYVGADGRPLGVPYPVQAGDAVGVSVNLQSLNYDRAVGPHVHLQVMVDGQWVDPVPHLQLP